MDSLPSADTETGFVLVYRGDKYRTSSRTSYTSSSVHRSGCRVLKRVAGAIIPITAERAAECVAQTGKVCKVCGMQLIDGKAGADA